MARPDAFLGTVLPTPETLVIDKQGRMTEEWRRALENMIAALFGTDGSADVTADIPTGSYVGGIVGDPARGLTIAGAPGPGYTVTFTLAQNLQTSASPTFVNGTFTGNMVLAGMIDGRDPSIDGTKLDGIQAGATANSTDAALRARASHTGTQALATISDVTITAANLNALDDGANTALHFHDADRARANHSGTQLASTISDFNTASDARVAIHAGLADPHTGYQLESQREAASGYAGLNAATRTVRGVDATDDIIVDLATKGLVLKDTQGTPHYWRLTVTGLGLLVTADLGTTKP